MIEDRIDALLRAPASALFLLTVSEMYSSLEDSLTPPFAFDLACSVIDEINPWRHDHLAMREEAIQRAAGLRDLAARVLAHAATAWWFTPLCRDSQVAVGAKEPKLHTPENRSKGWEIYAQKPANPLFTSTTIAGTTSLTRAMENGTGDYTEKPPLVRVELAIDSAARVLEINGPADWHALCIDEGVLDESGPPAKGFFAPDWSRVARSWDGVHLTFGGLLTSLHVPTVSAGGKSMLWAWDVEQTLWLHDVFSSRQLLDPIREFNGDRPSLVHLTPHSGTPLTRVGQPKARWLKRNRRADHD